MRLSTSYGRYGKRVFDLVSASIALILLSPILLFVAVLIGLRLGRPILFRQQRPGLAGTPFTLYKFRTMHDRRDENGNLLADDERLSFLGRRLRAASLDELPELFNVVRGDMSLVGPRPLLMRYLDRYTGDEMRRHDVLPGVTGWAQIHGRNAVTWSDRFQLDLWYVEHRSLWLDLRILGKTAWMVLKGDGISAPGHATMPEFRGSRRDG